MFFSARARFIFYSAIIMVLSPFLFAVARARRNGARARIIARTPRVLVIPVITRVGDVVCSTPVYRQLKISFPDSNLSVVVAHKVFDILKNNPRINNLIDYNAPQFCGFLRRGRFFLSLFYGKYDAVISLGSSPLGTISALASASPIRIKTSVPSPSFFEICTDWMNTDLFLYKTGTFLQNHYVKLLSVLEIKSEKPVKEVFTTKESDEKAKNFLSSSFGGQVRLIIGITVSAGNKIKEWPLSRFAELADILIEKYEARIVFIDSVLNSGMVEKTISLMKNKKETVRAIHFSLEELPSLIKRLSAFIAVDTGAIYIAHALRVPLIDIIGPVEPNEQPPNDERSIQILPKGNIAPTSFVLAVPVRGAKHLDAVLSINVSDVLRGFEKLHELIL